MSDLLFMYFIYLLLFIYIYLFMLFVCCLYFFDGCVFYLFFLASNSFSLILSYFYFKVNKYLMFGKDYVIIFLLNLDKIGFHSPVVLLTFARLCYRLYFLSILIYR